MRERGIASNPKMEYQVFLCIIQKNSAMATLGLKEMGKFLWEGREKGVAMFPYKGKNNKISCSFGELNPDLPGERQVS